MSPNKTLYIREEDRELWGRVGAAAHAGRQSLSQFMTDLIRRHVPAPPAGDMERITVQVGDTERTWTEGFTGRWLARAESSKEKCGIALTKGGQFAWYEAIPGGKAGDLDVFPDLEALEAYVEELWSGDPARRRSHRSLLAEAAEALGQPHVIWRDI